MYRGAVGGSRTRIYFEMRVGGIGPPPESWQDPVLPLNHTRKIYFVGFKNAEGENRTRDAMLFQKFGLYHLPRFIGSRTLPKIYDNLYFSTPIKG